MTSVPSSPDCKHIAHFFPPQLIVQWFEEALPDYGWRDRLLPRPILFLGFVLYAMRGFDNLTHAFSDAAARLRPDTTPSMLSPGSVSPARQRLPLEVLQCGRRHILELAGEPDFPSLIEGFRVLCLDGTTFTMPDTLENEAAYGRLSGGRGPAAFCSLRSVLVMDAASHLFLAERHGSCKESEVSFADDLIDETVRPGVLLEADRLFLSYQRIKRIVALGGDALIRARKNLDLPVLKELPDGSYLSRMEDGTKDKARDRSAIAIRVISYTVLNASGTRSNFRLVTTVLDHERLPAPVAARGYHLRWREESGIRELKWLRDRHRIPHLPGQSPQAVEQDYAALLLIHSILRCAMICASREHGGDPTRLSLSGTKEVIWNFLVRGPHPTPEQLWRWLPAMFKEIARQKLPRPTSRTCPREVKPKTNRYPSKRPRVDTPTAKCKLFMRQPLAC